MCSLLKMRRGKMTEWFGVAHTYTLIVAAVIIAVVWIVFRWK